MRTIVCFGDSNTHGSDPESEDRLERDVRWPGVLRAELGAAFEVIEEGLGGRTTHFDDPYLEQRRGSDHLLPVLWSHEPVDLVILMLGTNDLKLAARAVDIARGMDVLVDMARRSLAGPAGQPPAIVVVAPVPIRLPAAENAFWGYDERSVAMSAELGELYRQVARAWGAGFLDAGSVAQAHPVEGIHLDAAAHAAIGRALAEVVRRRLGS